MSNKMYLNVTKKEMTSILCKKMKYENKFRSWIKNNFKFFSVINFTRINYFCYFFNQFLCYFNVFDSCKYN